MKLKHISVKEFCAFTSKSERSAQRIFKELRETNPELFIEEHENGRLIRKIQQDYVLGNFTLNLNKEKQRQIAELTETKKKQRLLVLELEEIQKDFDECHELRTGLLEDNEVMQTTINDFINENEEQMQQLKTLRSLNFKRQDNLLEGFVKGAITVIVLYIVYRIYRFTKQ